MIHPSTQPSLMNVVLQLSGDDAPLLKSVIRGALQHFKDLSKGQWLAELSPIDRVEPQPGSTSSGTIAGFGAQRVRLTLSKSLAPAWTLPGWVPRTGAWRSSKNSRGR